MNSTILKSKMPTVVFITVGFLSGYLASKYKYEKMAQEEIAAIRKYYDEKMERNEFSKKKFQNTEKIESAKNALREYRENHSDITPTDFDVKTIQHRTTDYVSYSRPVQPGEDLSKFEHPVDEDNDIEPDSEEAKEYFEQVELNNERKNAPGPKIIKYEDYGDNPNYEERVLFYYSEDDVLTTDEDEVVDDPTSLIGDALIKYNFKRSNETSIYVRNFKLGVDYEIVKYYGSYSDGV